MTVKLCMTALGLMLGATSLTQAAGCAPVDGAENEAVEALNQLLLDSDFAGLAARIEAETGMDISGGIEPVAAAFATGFDGCTTVLQRSDTGGTMQSVVMYHGKAGPLFGFYRTIELDGKTKLFSFSLSASADEIMAKVN